MSEQTNNRRTLLIVVWIGLLLWGAGLVYWWQQQEQRLEPPTAAAVANVDDSTASSPASAQPDAAVPQVEAAAEAWWVSNSTASPSGAIDLLAMARDFDGEAAQARIRELAAAPFDGRRAGTAGGLLAGEAIAAEFQRLGLQPAGDLLSDGSRSYFQQFPLDFFVTYTAPPVLEIFAPDGRALGPYEFRHDYSSYVRGYAGQGDVEGPVVWANYCLHDDFDQLDAVGAVVLCRVGGSEDATRNAIEHGAAGLLLVAQTDARPIDRIGRYNVPLVPAPVPTFLVTPEVVDDLLAGSDVTFEDLSIQFQGLLLQTTARLSVALETQPGINGRNVLGMLPGSDPDFAADVVVIGGHYDHIGDDPDGQICTRTAIDAAPDCQESDGAVYWGANDNASGIAVMLEIARQWQEVGHQPRRSVLFAAWDAEEQGLWGSSHYVAHPTVPLANTTAYLNMDMVGAGTDALSIDGPGSVADRLIQLAPTFGITTTLEDFGRSDHVPFRSAGIDASMMIWFAGDDSDPKLAHYHRPIDVPAVIEPEKLQGAGELAEMTLLSLASAEPEIDALLARRSAAITAGDLDAFLATSLSDRRAADTLWWDTLMQNQPKALSASVVQPLVAGDVATATLRYQITPQSGAAQRIDQELRLARQPDGWRVAGPAMQALIGDRLTLHVAAGQTSQASVAPELLELAERQQAEIADALGLPMPQPGGQLFLHRDQESLQAAVGLTLPDEIDAWAAGDATYIVAQGVITRTSALTTALTLLALTQTGLREEQAPWLFAALPEYLVPKAEQEALAEKYLPVLQQALQGELPYGLEDFPSALAAESHTPRWRALARAMTEALLAEDGLTGVGDFATALAGTGDVDATFRQVTGMTAGQFDSAWQESARGRFNSVQAEIDELVNRRQTAIAAGNRAAFLTTSDPDDPRLQADEGAWFDRALDPAAPLSEYSLMAKLQGETPDGVLADFTTSWRTAAGALKQGRQQALLVRRGGQLFYGGPTRSATRSGNITLLHSPSASSLAEALAPMLDQAAAQIARRMGIEPSPLTVILYSGDAALGLAADPNLPAGTSLVTTPGGSLHAAVGAQANASAAADVRNSLLPGVVEQLMRQAGVPTDADSRWLRVGLGLNALQWIDSNVGWQQAGRLAGKVPLAAQQGRFWPLSQLPDPSTLAGADKTLAEAQAWDATDYLLAHAGPQGLGLLLQDLAGGATLDQALQTALNTSLTEFEADWVDSTPALHVPEAWRNVAESFDAQRGLATAAELAGQQFAGRETGSSGGRAAAEAIAAEFQQLGLEPAGDNASFFQTFPISYTAPAGPPMLAFERDGQRLELAYRQDFIERTEGNGLGGAAAGPAVWVRDLNYTGMLLDGKIVLRKPTESLAVEMQRAAEAGAGGLILVSDAGPADMNRRIPIDGSTVVSPTLPVAELTKAAFDRLMEFTDLGLVRLNTAPAALGLDLNAALDIPLTPMEAANGVNVLGLLPGSDPALADEAVILSAHFDGPGTDGAGVSYPGANDNASGVATLLEIARSWQAAGVKPARPVLFVAWDGNEIAQKGAQAYLLAPAVPLTQTLGMLNLDNVGAGKGFFLTYQGDRNREAVTNHALALAATVLNARADGKQPEVTGDQTPFQQASLPATLVIWDGADDDANSVKDVAETLDEVKLRRSGQVVSLALRWLADH